MTKFTKRDVQQSIAPGTTVLKNVRTVVAHPVYASKTKAEEKGKRQKEVVKRLKAATRAVLKVGDGRGFVIETDRARYVITAAHCLPHLPPCMTFSHEHERTYANLIGPLGEEPTVWAECLFVDPVADIAVLGAPDNQVLHDEAHEYDSLIEDAEALSIGSEQGPAWLLGLDGQWSPAVAKLTRRWLLLSDCKPTEAGMSGSPIVADNGLAIGVVSTSANGAQGALTLSLPGWLLRKREPGARH